MPIYIHTPRFLTRDVLLAVMELTVKDISRIIQMGFISPQESGEDRGTRREFSLKEIYGLAFISWVPAATGLGRGLQILYLNAFGVRATAAFIPTDGSEAKFPEVDPMHWPEFQIDHWMVIPRRPKAARVVKINELKDVPESFAAKDDHFIVVPIGWIKFQVDKSLWPQTAE